jgi:hypothetical protein
VITIEVAIGPASAPGTFKVEVVDSPAGEASAVVNLDIDDLLARRGQLQHAVLASAAVARRVLPESEQLVHEAGRALFTGLLGTGEIAGRYRASAAVAAERGQELRVVLRIDTPALAGLPWEAMYDQAVGTYVCRHVQLVRHVPVASVPSPLQVHPPLQILGVVSSPRGLPALDIEKEQEQLTRALKRLASQSLAEVHWAPSATWADLQDLLMDGHWHVLHFIGHGDFDPAQDEGVLALVREDGRADLVAAHRLTDLLRQARPMPRLVVLNSCSGAAVGISDLFSGTAAALVRGGVSAVAAMQYEISDPAAVAFARGFYTAIAHGRGVDDAISSGRVAIIGISDRTLEWVTPVLYLRGHDSHLFALPPRSATQPRVPGEDASSADFGTTRRDHPADTSSPGPGTRQDGPALHEGKQLERSLSARTRPNNPPTAPVPSRLIRTLSSHTGVEGKGRTGVEGVAFSPDGALLATASDDRTARLWEVATGAMVHTLTGHTGWVTGVAFSPDGTLLATVSHDQSVRLWKVATGQAVRQWEVTPPSPVDIFSNHDYWVHGVAFSPDGALLATASNDHTARLWEVATGAAMHELTGHTSEVAEVAFSPDGTLLATASNDRTARLWEVATGAMVHTLTGHTHWVHGVAFSPDGALLATASADGPVRLWG